MSTQPAYLIFEDGTTFLGKTFTSLSTSSSQHCIAEIVFNTATTGYQEVLTDPSYYGQMVMMTYPLIGSYGINNEDIESKKIYLSALIIKEYIELPSNWRSTKTLRTYLDEHNILGVEGMDTRAIVLYLRKYGALKALLTTQTDNKKSLIDQLNNTHHTIENQQLVQQVTCINQYNWPAPKKTQYRVAIIDCGSKYNIARLLTRLNCACTLFPYDVQAHFLLQEPFDGVLLSNGPGDPTTLSCLVKTVQKLLGKLPIFGVCLGHQLLGLAIGAKTIKLKFGHHGINHPIQHLATQKVAITSQNHNYALHPNSIDPTKARITHINLNDQTIAGIELLQAPAFSVQYHPEGSPGPHDAYGLFKQFIAMMQKHQIKKQINT